MIKRSLHTPVLLEHVLKAFFRNEKQVCFQKDFIAKLSEQIDFLGFDIWCWRSYERSFESK